MDETRRSLSSTEGTAMSGDRHPVGTCRCGGPLWHYRWWWTCMSPHPLVLSSLDPQPPVGTTVKDADGDLWRRVDSERRCWMPLDDNGSYLNGDIESWTRVAGNHGPVTVVMPAGCDS